MIKNKQKIIKKAEKISENIHEFASMIRNLKGEQMKVAFQIIDEFGFKEDLNQVAWKFGNLARMLEDTEVIDGHQLWIDQNKGINVVVNGDQLSMSSDNMNYVFESLLEHTGNRKTAKKIFKWYFEQVY